MDEHRVSIAFCSQIYFLIICVFNFDLTFRSVILVQLLEGGFPSWRVVASMMIDETTMDEY